MRIIETTATVSEDGTLSLQVPADVAPGEHRVVIVIEEQPITLARPAAEFPTIDVESWPTNLSLRRHDMYGGWGR